MFNEYFNKIETDNKINIKLNTYYNKEQLDKMLLNYDSTVANNEKFNKKRAFFCVIKSLLL